MSYKKDNFTDQDQKKINDVFRSIRNIEKPETESEDASQLIEEVFFVLDLLKISIKKSIK